jgi:hypothetical protein
MPAEVIAVVGGLSSDEQLDVGEGGDILADDHSTDRITDHENKVCSKSDREIHCNRIDAIEKFLFPHKMLFRSDNLSSIHTMFWTAVLASVSVIFFLITAGRPQSTESFINSKPWSCILHVGPQGKRELQQRPYNLHNGLSMKIWKSDQFLLILRHNVSQFPASSEPPGSPPPKQSRRPPVVAT